VSDVDPAIVNPIISVTDLDAPEYSARDPRPVSERYRSDLAELFTTSSEPRREREGLPAGYRMRADSHYVEQLSAPVEVRAMESGRARTLPIDPNDVTAGLREALSDISAAGSWLADPGSPLARSAAIDVIRSQAWRASWLINAQTTLSASRPGRCQPRRLGVVLTRVVEGFAPESRLLGVDIQMLLPDWNVQANLDEDALVAGLTGAVIATLGVMGQPRGAVVTIMAAPPASGEVTVDVAQEHVAPPSDGVSRFFDPLWRDRPGGPAAAIGAWAARAAAVRHGGDATLVTNEGRGTTIRLTLGR
jgi:hypothetical protein